MQQRTAQMLNPATFFKISILGKDSNTSSSKLFEANCNYSLQMSSKIDIK